MYSLWTYNKHMRSLNHRESLHVFRIARGGVVKFLSEYRRTEFITKSTCMETMYDSARGACESVCR
jgi:hypothetical protein